MNFLTWVNPCSNAIVAYSGIKYLVFGIFAICFGCFFTKFILDNVFKLKKDKKYSLYFVLGFLVGVGLAVVILPFFDVLAGFFSNTIFGDFSKIESSVDSSSIVLFSKNFICSCLLLFVMLSYAYFNIVNSELKKSKNKKKINKSIIYIVYVVLVVVGIVISIFTHNYVISNVDNMWTCDDYY